MVVANVAGVAADQAAAMAATVVDTADVDSRMALLVLIPCKVLAVAVDLPGTEETAGPSMAAVGPLVEAEGPGAVASRDTILAGVVVRLEADIRMT